MEFGIKGADLLRNKKEYAADKIKEDVSWVKI